ncbi:MAG: methyltransferase domain-containing protein [Chthonomonas sp.]|nr:methyltransferase domain-containing protein [Chthonomonas sp.]
MSSPVPSNWREFFDLQAPTYDQNDFTKNSRVEVQFLLEQAQTPAGGRVLDLGCGTGRHAAIFAEQGFAVTGVDFSPGMLAEARRKAPDATWIEADIRPWRSEKPFDLVLLLCESPLNLTGHDEDPVAHAMACLRSMADNLAPGGTAIFTALNAFAQVRAMRQEDVDAGAFDPVTMLAEYMNDMNTPAGMQTVFIRERLFFPSELVAMAFHSGLNVSAVYGGTAGEWGERALRLDEIEALYIAKKRS